MTLKGYWSIVLLVASVLQAQTPGATTTEPKTTVIRFYASVNEQTVSRLLANVDAKIKTGTKRFVLLISSPGGSVFAGLSAYHYLKGIPAEVVTHNFGEVDSIATVMYCAGSKRYSVPEGRFLLHGITLTFAPNANLDEGGMSEQLKSMQQQVASIAAVISGCSGKPLAEVQDTILKRTVLTAPEAKTWGLVHEISSKLYDDGADVVPILNQTDVGGQLPNLAQSVPSIQDYKTHLNEAFTKANTYFSTPEDFSTLHPQPNKD